MFRHLLTRGLATSALRRSTTGGRKTMQQVEVDEPHVKEKLGRLQMDMINKAEKLNADRASRHRQARRGESSIALGCVVVILSIYSYTIFAMKQEEFLDDFEMPDPLEEKEQETSS